MAREGGGRRDGMQAPKALNTTPHNDMAAASERATAYAFVLSRPNPLLECHFSRWEKLTSWDLNARERNGGGKEELLRQFKRRRRIGGGLEEGAYRTERRISGGNTIGAAA